MESLTNLWLRLKTLARRGQLERDLEDEMSFHMAMRAAKLDNPVKARRVFGNTTSVTEECRELWTFVWLESLARDVRFALRQLRRDPGYTAVAAVTLALGIGATTSIFSTFDAVLWHSEPLPRNGEVVSVLQATANPHMPSALSAGDFEDIRANSANLASLTGWANATATIIDAGGEPVRVEASRVTLNFFDVAGVQPAMGRGFQSGEDEPERDRVAVISDDLWRNRFASDPHIVGRAVRINGRNCTVVGVMPPKFKFPRGWRDLWMPVALTPDQRHVRTFALLETAGRLKPGRTLANLTTEVNALALRLEKQYPATNQSRHLVAWPIDRALRGDYVAVYQAMLLAASLFVLLICCVNVANLQFARATARWREVAVRLALGAGRGRIVRQLVAESMVLATIGGVLGLVAARWCLAAIRWSIPLEMRRYMTGWAGIELNSRALLFTLAAAAASGILSGLAPAWRCSRSVAQGRFAPPGRHRLRSILVAVQIALAVLLLTGAGLMVRGFHTLVGGRGSLQPESLLTFRLSLSPDQYRQDWQITAFYDGLLRRIATLPGVKSATVATGLPYSRHGTARTFAIENREQSGPPPSVLVQAVSQDYFRTLLITLRSGAMLGNDSQPQAVVSERMAHLWWPNESPVGRRLRIGNAWMTIRGVVSDAPYSVMDREMRPIVYVPYGQLPEREMNIGIRTAVDPMTLASAVTAAVRTQDREQPVENLATMEVLVHQEAFGVAALAWLMGGLGVLALVLSAVGVYGVMSYVVSQQGHEIGIRLALGASRAGVLGMLVRRGMVTATIGVAVGLVPAYGLARLMAFAVWGVGSGDPVTMVGIPAGLLAISAAAILIPARRAVKADPMCTLRAE